VSEENVLRFEPSSEGGMARRGAPDKTHAQPLENLEVVCPYCDTVLFMETKTLAVGSDLLCAGCDTAIPLTSAETADLSR
jgi:hypothetical protein